MKEQQPNPQRLKSIKLDLEKRYLQIESSDATALHLSLTPEGIRWELLQPPTITTARAVDQLVETAEREVAPAGEGKEKNPTVTLTGRIKGQVREGRPARDGKKTAWGLVAVHEEGSEQAKMVSATFYRHTANAALSLPADAEITAAGYLTPSEDPTKKDSFKVFNLINYTGKTQVQDST
jgi:hypothetical protein